MTRGSFSCCPLSVGGCLETVRLAFGDTEVDRGDKSLIHLAVGSMSRFIKSRLRCSHQPLCPVHLAPALPRMGLHIVIKQLAVR